MQLDKIKEEFMNLTKLYHYTRFETAIEILQSNSLKFGKLKFMNDIHEVSKLVYVEFSKYSIKSSDYDILDVIKDEIFKYRQISFTMDGEGGKKGFDRHQMWGLYAEQGSGVCLVFDKDILSKRLDESIIHAPVIYEDIVKTFYKSQSTNLNVVCDSIKENYQEIFFSKRIEWEHENEYRMMKRCPDDNREEYLNFGAALKYIIISNIYMESDIVKYNNNITELKKHTNVPILVYGNGLDDYSINDIDGQKTIWTSSNEYNILIPGKNCEIDLK